MSEMESQTETREVVVALPSDIFIQSPEGVRLENNIVLAANPDVTYDAFKDGIEQLSEELRRHFESLS